jgi:hypothetical protein
LRAHAVSDSGTSWVKGKWSREPEGRELSVCLDVKSAGGRDRHDLAYYLSREPAEYEFWIATVPDPLDSKFALEFDAVVDGIQRAFEARGFTLRSSWLPWPHPRDTADGPAGDARPTHRNRPGALLFRNSRSDPAKGPPALALVCLVGETPTAGIHKPAFAEALALRDQLDRAIRAVHERQLAVALATTQGAPRLACHLTAALQLAAAPGTQDAPRWARQLPPEKFVATDTVVPVVAPFFSGSQASIALALSEKQRASPGMKLWVVSGSASALKPDLFDKNFIKLQTTVVPHRLVTEAVLGYLAGCRETDGAKYKEERYRLKDRVAILRESNTVFGSSQGPKNPEPEPKAPWPEGPVIDIPFPLSISQLQAEVEKDLKSSPRVAWPRRELVGPRLRAPGGPQAGLPEPYDLASAAASAGAGLRSILTAIRRSRVRYVGIVATDNRDVVFLNRLIRKECPGVRVFTTEPSFALTHPDDAHHMRGMVVGSTYPLHPVTQHWSRWGKKQAGMVPFPTQASEGYYNAILAQSGGKARARMLNYRGPRLPRGADDAGNPVNGPPIWISVVGQRGQLLPVHCFNRPREGTSDDPELALGPSEGEQSLPTVGVSVGVLLGSAGAVVVLALLLLSLSLAPGLWERCALGPPRDEVRLAGPTASRDGNGPPGKGDTAWMWTWRGVMLAAILLFALPYALPAWEAYEPCCEALSWRHEFILGAAFLILLEVGALAVLLGLWGAPKELWKKGCVCQSVVSSAAVTLGSVFDLVVLASLWRHPKLLTVTALATAALAGLVFAPRVRRWWRAAHSEPDAEAGRWRWGYLALAGVVVVGSCCAGAWWWCLRGPAERLFLYVRASDLSAGTSPLMPMFLLGAAAFALGLFSFRQANQARRPWLNCPYPPARWAGPGREDRQLRTELNNPLWFIPLCFLRRSKGAAGDAARLSRAWSACLQVLPILLFGVVALWIIQEVSLPSGEGQLWDRTMWAAFALIAGGVVFTLARFLALWWRLQRLMEEVLGVPMVGAFERLPYEIARLFGGLMHAQQPQRRHLEALAWALPRPRREQVFNQGDHLGELAGDLEKLATDFLDRPAAAWTTRSVNEAFGSARPAGEAAEKSRQEVAALPSLEKQVVGARVTTHAADESPDKQAAAPSREPEPQVVTAYAAVYAPEKPNDEEASTPSPERQFVAAYVAIYLAPYFVQLRLLVYALVTAAPLLLFAAASYPFQPDRPRLSALVVLLAAVVAATVYVLYAINRDGLVSRIMRTTPHHLTPDRGFLSSVAYYVLPLVAVLVAQVFGLFRFVLEPILGLFE